MAGIDAGDRAHKKTAAGIALSCQLHGFVREKQLVSG